jgi:hypothetical protein
MLYNYTFSCRNSEITFTIRCEFLFARNKFESDDILFNRLRTRS